MSRPNMPLARTDHLIVQDMGDEILLYDTQKDQAHVLNQTAALVWKRSNGKRTAAELSQLVARELHAEPSIELTELALAQLSKANLLTQSTQWSGPAVKLTRREFLQKASIAAMIIPVVKTISTSSSPVPASCLGLGATCSTNGQCCSGFCFETKCVQP